MTNKHPITPPPELFKQWEDDILNERDNVDHVLDCTWRNGFQAGADQELEACRLWVSENCDIYSAVELIQFRRPKPPSLKEQALEALENLNGECLLEGFECPEKVATIRRALESLPDV